MKKYLLILIACAMIAGCGGSSTPPSTFTVGGTVTGLTGAVTLQNNGGETITVSANGAFTFPTAKSIGSPYAVTITGVAPNYYTCSVTNATGNVLLANVTNVGISCALVPQTAMACGNATSIGKGNVAPLVVDGFPCAAGGTVGAANTGNVPYTTVKICAPGSTTNCQIIDHVTVDTGSSGLRIAASALSPNLQPGNGLPAVVGGSASTSLAECEIYVSSYVYGPIVSADVYIGGKLVKNANMQVFGSPSNQIPAACSNQGGIETDTTQSFGGNGLIGVSFELTDLGEYFDCQSADPSQCTVNNAYNGLPNLVSLFDTDNNGVVLSLPPVPDAGLSSPVVGTLNFGVSTQANNTPAVSATAIVNDPQIGEFAAQVGGVWYTAYIDSGTALMFFNDTANTDLTLCPDSSFNAGLYCPATPQNIPINFANFGSTTVVGSQTYQVGNADAINTLSAMAFRNVAGPITTSTTLTQTTMAFGLSAFYGHNMYFLFNTMTAPGTGLGGTASSKVTGPINSIQ
ncbi:MAG TPA: DUF3443 family protein [Burkholderiaceae bacterium]|jgi:hypothetical protein|nr:DUF3443 family protein [Burkholderiaceae bacterium]